MDTLVEKLTVGKRHQNLAVSGRYVLHASVLGEVFKGRRYHTGDKFSYLNPSPLCLRAWWVRLRPEVVAEALVGYVL